MISKENIFFRKMFIVTEYAALTLKFFSVNLDVYYRVRTCNNSKRTPEGSASTSFSVYLNTSFSVN